MTVFKKVRLSFRYAFQGWRAAFSTQLNFRIQCFCAAITILMGLFFAISVNEWLWVLVNIALVMAAELLNSAIETLVDLVSPGYHEKAGRVKDIAAGAVTVLVINALIAAGIIFIPKIIQASGLVNL